jgi:hypothetical protein
MKLKISIFYNHQIEHYCMIGSLDKNLSIGPENG